MNMLLKDSLCEAGKIKDMLAWWFIVMFKPCQTASHEKSDWYKLKQIVNNMDVLLMDKEVVSEAL